MLKWIKRTLLLGFVMTPVSADICEHARSILAAYESGQALPVISQRQADLDLQQAGHIQQRYLNMRSRSDSIVGYKAALTAPSIQRRFRVEQPLPGVLFATGRLGPDARVDVSAYARLGIETELGFVVGEDIREKVADVAGLQKKIRMVVPVVELPEVGLSLPQQAGGPDLLAVNVGAKQYIVAERLPIPFEQVDSIQVRLRRNGKILATGSSQEVLGGQWQAALWLVNTALERGWRIDAGALLLTGAVGGLSPGTVGSYEADYESIGKIRFEVYGSKAVRGKAPDG